MSLLPVLAIVGAAADVPSTEPTNGVNGSVSGYYFLEPSGRDSVLAIGSIELGRVHLEGRYGYEAPRTGSVFAGHRFDVLDGTLELSVTPMVGGVFGRIYGVAPGFEVDAKLWKFELSSESELVFDFAQSGFFYSWSELVVRPVRWLAAGGVLQRARFFRETSTVDSGAVAAVTVGAITARAYAFVPSVEQRFYALALQADL